jgi:hypothetical protein
LSPSSVAFLLVSRRAAIDLVGWLAVSPSCHFCAAVAFVSIEDKISMYGITVNLNEKMSSCDDERRLREVMSQSFLGMLKAAKITVLSHTEDAAIL